MADALSPGVFLSYRREDAGPYARTLQLQLAQLMPDVPVFIDLDSIEPGLDFTEAIDEAVNSCAVLIAFIGRQWLTLTDQDGERRLDNPDDYVRFEVRTALERGVRVIPVLIDHAQPLRQRDLPDDLQKLARLNAHRLTYERYQDDVDRLLDLIRRVLDRLAEQVQAKERAQAEGRARAAEEARAASEQAFEADVAQAARRQASEQARGLVKAARKATTQPARPAQPRKPAQAAASAQLRTKAGDEEAPPVGFFKMLRSAFNGELIQPGIGASFNPPRRMRITSSELVLARVTTKVDQRVRLVLPGLADEIGQRACRDYWNAIGWRPRNGLIGDALGWVYHRDGISRMMILQFARKETFVYCLISEEGVTHSI